MKTTEYPCGCVLGSRDPLRLCERAKDLVERAIAERDDLFDAGLGGQDEVPGNASHLLDLHWSKSVTDESGTRAMRATVAKHAKRTKAEDEPQQTDIFEFLGGSGV